MLDREQVVPCHKPKQSQVIPTPFLGRTPIELPADPDVGRRIRVPSQKIGRRRGGPGTVAATGHFPTCGISLSLPVDTICPPEVLRPAVFDSLTQSARQNENGERDLRVHIPRNTTFGF